MPKQYHPVIAYLVASNLALEHGVGGSWVDVVLLALKLSNFRLNAL
jgi:hypothetical protein